MRTPPDERWLPFIALATGSFLIIGLVGLAYMVALGKVEAQTSAGLDSLIGTLKDAAMIYAGCAWGWKMFGGTRPPDDKDDKAAPE